MKERKVFRPTGGPEGIPNEKTGTVLTTTMHVFCAVIGAAVLMLPNAISWLGWIAGPLTIIIFYGISLLTCHLMSDVYEINGIEHARYHHAVSHLLGRKDAIAVSVFQMINIILTTWAYTITGATALQQIIQHSCSLAGQDVTSTGCFYGGDGLWKLILMYGCCQLFLSQIRNLEEAWWLSSIGTVSSVIYALIILIIAAANSGNKGGTIGGRPGNSPADKTFNIFNALGSTGFAFNFMLILLEICDTIRQPPSAIPQMKKATNLAVTVAFVFYLSIAVTGYLAEGNTVDGNIMVSFTGPVWALLIANIAVLLQMFSAYQVYAQSCFNTYESWLKWWLLKREFNKKVNSDDHISNVRQRSRSKQANAAVEAALAAVDMQEVEGEKDTIPRADEHHMMGLDHVRLAPLNERIAADNVAASTVLTRIEEARPAPTRIRTRTRSLGRNAASAHQLVKSKVITRAPTFLENMFDVDTGFANEEMPLNGEGILLPMWMRICARSVYVLIITVLACIAPFFTPFIGLVGAATYFPLAIYFPHQMFRRVYGPLPKRFSVLLWVIWWSMLVVGIVATIGACRNIIVGWSEYKVFSN